MSNHTLSAQEVLIKLHKSLRSADFDAALGTLTSVDLQKLLLGEDELISLKIRCLASEVWDYFGDYPEARNAIATYGSSAVEAMRQASKPRRAEEYRLLKQRIWAAIHWGYVLYRASDYVKAKSVFEQCRKTLREYVATESEPCLFTWSRIWYSLGLVHRQSYEYPEAKQAFVKSIDYAWRELQRRFTCGDSQGYAEARALTEYCVAKSLALGLGWVYYTESALEIAEPVVLSAKVLLAGIQERIIKAYVDIIHGGIQRSGHADNRPRLEEAIALLRRSYDIFSQSKDHKEHEAYKIRAANELALAFLQGYQCGSTHTLADLQKAENYAEEAERLSRKKGDVRWLCNALIIKSRIHRNRGDYGKALDAASAVLTEGQGHIFLLIDGWIARGEAEYEKGEYEAAVNDFSEALKYAGGNSKVRTVCLLHLARAHNQQGDIRLASTHLRQAEDASGQQNAYIRVLFRKVRGEIAERTRDFTIQFSEEVHRAKDVEEKFHGFLTEWARSKTGTDREAAAALGIKLATFYAWRSAADLPKNRRVHKRRAVL